MTGKATVKRGPAHKTAKGHRKPKPPRKLRTAATSEQLAALRDELAQGQEGPCGDEA